MLVFLCLLFRHLEIGGCCAMNYLEVLLLVFLTNFFLLKSLVVVVLFCVFHHVLLITLVFVDILLCLAVLVS